MKLTVARKMERSIKIPRVRFWFFVSVIIGTDVWRMVKDVFEVCTQVRSTSYVCRSRDLPCRL